LYFANKQYLHANLVFAAMTGAAAVLSSCCFSIPTTLIFVDALLYFTTTRAAAAAAGRKVKRVENELNQVFLHYTPNFVTSPMHYIGVLLVLLHVLVTYCTLHAF
jgi:hypothetical protein